MQCSILTVAQLVHMYMIMVQLISALSCRPLRSILQQSGRGLLPGPWANTTNMHPIIPIIVNISIICLV